MTVRPLLGPIQEGDTMDSLGNWLSSQPALPVENLFPNVQLEPALLQPVIPSPALWSARHESCPSSWGALLGSWMLFNREELSYDTLRTAVHSQQDHKTLRPLRFAKEKTRLI